MTNTSEIFLTELDGMIESTVEFIADDQFVPDDCRQTLDRMIRGQDNEGRLQDLLALEHVRKLYTEIFQVEEDEPDDGGERAYFESGPDSGH